MKSVAYFSILVAFASLALAATQPDQPTNNVAPIVEPNQVVPQQQSAPVHPSQVIGQQEPQQGPNQAVVVPVEHHQIHHQQQQQHYPAYYSPAGMIHVVGEQVVGNNKQPLVGRSVEQYGQPESAALPANYKPFGSWGLYIGGNPADGYYTNYYKQLSNTVEKQQSGSPVGEPVKPTSALSPMLKQASGMSPFSGGDYYPFAYSMNDLSSVARSYVPPSAQAGSHAVEHSPATVIQPIPAAGAYGSPAPAFESDHHVAPFEPTSHHSVSPYASVESYAATKKFGSSSYVQQKEASKAAELPIQQQAPTKSYQQPRVYVYPQQVGPLAAPVAFSPVQVGQQQQAQVVAYPVPVGSQIVGSQAGVDGAFAPYGVHAFTRYAVKPTVVTTNEQQNSYHYGVSSQLPAYKQQQSAFVNGPTYHYQPVGGYYGYPLNQLHYSQGSIVPAVHGGEQPIAYQHSPAVVAGGSQVEASEKSETSSSSAGTGSNTNNEEKTQVNNKQN